MPFSVTGGGDLLAVEPGQTAPFSVAVRLDGPTAEEFEFTVEGLDPDWTLIPSGSVRIEPGREHLEKVFIKPPKAPESTAGDYPFAIRVRSLDTGESRSVQAVLHLKTFHHVGAEIDPKKGYVSPFKRQNAFEVTVVNLGNREHTFSLAGSDPEDRLAFEFADDHVTVPPGSQRSVEVIANPVSTPVLSTGRLFGFSVTARATDSPAVVTQTQAQLEQRAFLSPVTLLLVLLAAAIVGAWIWAMPKPPQVSLSAEPMRVTRGGSITLNWRATGAAKVRVTRVGAKEPIYEGADLAGRRTVTIDSGTTARFEATAIRDGATAKSETVSIAVEEPPVIPAARIVRASVDKRSVRLGDSFVLSYELKDAESAKLFPDNVSLDVNATSIAVRPATTGKLTYEIIAYNSEAKAVSKTFEVSVYDEATSKISNFSASPSTIYDGGGDTLLSWSCEGAARVELRTSGRPENVDLSGTRTVTLTKTTEFVLVAYDDAGRSVRRRITVRVKAPDPTTTVEPETTPPPDPDPASGPAEPPATTGGGTPPPR